MFRFRPTLMCAIRYNDYWHGTRLLFVVMVTGGYYTSTLLGSLYFILHDRIFWPLLCLEVFSCTFFSIRPENDDMKTEGG